MTKYVLNSGAVKKSLVLSKLYFAEIVKGLGDAPRILVCCFAFQREFWESKFIQDQTHLPTLVPQGICPSFELAMPDIFIEQVQRADIVYIRGGDNHLLQYWLKPFDLRRLWQGKTIAGISSGADVLVESFWTCDWRKCMDGFGLLPVKFLPHYQSDYGADDPRGPVDWAKAYKELQEYGDKTLPIHALREGEFVVIEK